MNNTNQEELKFEDALKMLIDFARNPNYQHSVQYGYDIYLPSLLMVYLRETGQGQGHDDYQIVWQKWSPLFYEAAWELCRRGILRPGIRQAGQQATDDGNGGNGYSITGFGKIWLSEADKDSFVPTEPERFGKLLAKYRNRFGEGYQERGQQAIRCYGAHTYLACCVMCGAAAESILLATVIAKEGDEEKILNQYTQRDGRHKIESLLFGKAKKHLQDKYRPFGDLLKHWRDESGHGKVSNIGEEEAFTALDLLLRSAQIMNDNWDELTKRDPS